MNDLSKEEKLKKIIEKINSDGISIYSLAKNTKLNQSGLGRLVSGKVENPHEATVDKLYNFLYSTNTVVNQLPKTRTIDGHEIKISDITIDILKNPEYYEDDPAFAAYLDKKVLKGVRDFYEGIGVNVISKDKA